RLQFSKIGKIMRHIHLLEEAQVPRDDEFHFRVRAKALVYKWQHLISDGAPCSAQIRGRDIIGARA
ncbi:hypothetical protein B0H13DRAFT_1587488, partial [Mycena leptocephala]